MSQADFDAMKPLFSTITDDALRKPNMPVHIYLQEAQNLRDRANRDKEALLAVGFDWPLVESLPARIGALQVAESNWFTERDKREAAQLRWSQEAPEAYALRDHLLRSMRYAYRNDPALMAKVHEIAQGNSHADMLQDLSDIATLGRDFSAPLVAIKLDLAELDRAQERASSLGELLGQVQGEKVSNNQPLLVRDQAFTLLKQAVDEIRACGQYVFWNNERVREEYVSDYQRTIRRNASKKGQDSGTATGDQA